MAPEPFADLGLSQALVHPSPDVLTWQIIPAPDSTWDVWLVIPRATDSLVRAPFASLQEAQDWVAVEDEQNETEIWRLNILLSAVIEGLEQV